MALEWAKSADLICSACIQAAALSPLDRDAISFETVHKGAADPFTGPHQLGRRRLIDRPGQFDGTGNDQLAVVSRHYVFFVFHPRNT